jgi:hypothetical protein
MMMQPQRLTAGAPLRKPAEALLDSIYGAFLYPAAWGGIAQVVRATVS